jgi:hypothetical protein
MRQDTVDLLFQIDTDKFTLRGKVTAGFLVTFDNYNTATDASLIRTYLGDLILTRAQMVLWIGEKGVQENEAWALNMINNVAAKMG